MHEKPLLINWKEDCAPFSHQVIILQGSSSHYRWYTYTLQRRKHVKNQKKECTLSRNYKTSNMQSLQVVYMHCAWETTSLRLKEGLCAVQPPSTHITRSSSHYRWYTCTVHNWPQVTTCAPFSHQVPTSQGSSSHYRWYTCTVHEKPLVKNWKEDCAPFSHQIIILQGSSSHYRWYTCTVHNWSQVTTWDRTLYTVQLPGTYITRKLQSLHVVYTYCA